MSCEPTHDKCQLCGCEALLMSVYDYIYGWTSVCKHCYMNSMTQPREQDVLEKVA